MARLNGTDRPDTLPGTAEADTAYGYKGDDSVFGGQGNDTVFGGQGRDLVFGDLGSDALFGDLGSDTVYGNAGADAVYGNGGDDLLYGGQGDDTLYGGQGNDVVFGDRGNDTVLGDLGNDTVYGNMGSDAVYGNGGADLLFGGQGDDTLFGGQGNDVLSGDAGNDLAFGDLGDDLFIESVGNDTVVGGEGFDTVLFSMARAAYEIRALDNGDVLISSAQGTTLTRGIERLLFADRETDPLGRPSDPDSGSGSGSPPPAPSGPVYAISVVPGSGPEGTPPGDGTTFTYTVSRSGDASAAGSVAITFSGTAERPEEEGADYTVSGLTNGAVVFAAGAASASFTVVTRPGSSEEPDETVVASLGAITGGGSLGGMTFATATIVNDDLPATAQSYSIAVSPASVAEGDAGAGARLTYTVTRTDSTAAASIGVALDGTATGPSGDGADYLTSLAGGSLSFAAGATTASFTVDTVPDTTAEPNETVVATISNPSDGGSLGTASVTGTILNDDGNAGSYPTEDVVGLVNGGRTLVLFRTDTPQNMTFRSVTGILATEYLAGIDYRSADAKLYALGVDEGADTATLYTINPDTGTATVVGAPSGISGVGDLPQAYTFGLDFNPVADRLRVTTTNGLNLRINPNDGTVTAVDLRISGAAGLGAVAYTNGEVQGAAATTLYGLDDATDSLYVIGSPNTGAATLVAPITRDGSRLDFFSDNGFDIIGSTAYALINGTPGGSRLYGINLATGVATDLMPDLDPLTTTGIYGLTILPATRG